MADITTIPAGELLDDRRESLADIGICSLALAVGVTHHKDGMPVQHRIDQNHKIIAVIDAELKRRGIEVQR